MSETFGLRQRNSAATASMNHSGSRESGLVANSMINASPSQHGPVYKLHVPLLYSILPAFWQRFICSWRCLSFLAPKWEERYLIQMGNFLYKFTNPQAKSPKGTPLSIEAISVQLISSTSPVVAEGGAEFAMEHLPGGCESVFMVSTLRKRHCYAVSTREDALTWTNSLHQGRQEAITRSMGHSNTPYPKSWQYFDGLGKSYVKSKDRIHDRLEESNAREMEMTNIGDGGPLPRGYFG